MNKKVLIIEDDTNINHMIREALSLQGFACVQAFSGTEGLLLAKDKDFCVILLDLMLPGLSGEELLPQLKGINDTPIIVLSAKDALDSKLDLLRNGADDYMTKPFSLEELIARINILSKRFSSNTMSEPSDLSKELLQVKDLVLDQENFFAQINGNELNLTKLEFNILVLLMKNPARVFTKQDIYEFVWDEYYVGSDKTINVHVSNIRKKIKKYTENEYIETVWGIGFKLNNTI